MVVRLELKALKVQKFLKNQIGKTKIPKNRLSRFILLFSTQEFKDKPKVLMNLIQNFKNI